MRDVSKNIERIPMTGQHFVFIIIKDSTERIVVCHYDLFESRARRRCDVEFLCLILEDNFKVLSRLFRTRQVLVDGMLCFIRCATHIVKQVYDHLPKPIILPRESVGDEELLPPSECMRSCGENILSLLHAASERFEFFFCSEDVLSLSVVEKYPGCELSDGRRLCECFIVSKHLPMFVFVVTKNEMDCIWMFRNEVDDLCVFLSTVYYITDEDELVGSFIPSGCYEGFDEAFVVPMHISCHIDVAHWLSPSFPKSSVFIAAIWLYSTLSLYIGL